MNTRKGSPAEAAVQCRYRAYSDRVALTRPPGRRTLTRPRSATRWHLCQRLPLRSTRPAPRSPAIGSSLRILRPLRRSRRPPSSVRLRRVAPAFPSHISASPFPHPRVTVPPHLSHSSLTNESAQSSLSSPSAVESAGPPSAASPSTRDVGIDTTGWKVFGAGEWYACKHGMGRGRRRTERKLHLGVDETRKEIVAVELMNDRRCQAVVRGPVTAAGRKLPNRGSTTS